MELYELTVHELRDKLNKKEITSEDITRSYANRIKQKENSVEAFVTVLSEGRKQSQRNRSKNRKRGNYK